MSDEKKIDYAKENLDRGLDLAESHSEADRRQAHTALTASMAVSLYELRTAMIELKDAVTAVPQELQTHGGWVERCPVMHHEYGQCVIIKSEHKATLHLFNMGDGQLFPVSMTPGGGLYPLDEQPVSDDAKSAHRSEHDPLSYDIVPER